MERERPKLSMPKKKTNSINVRVCLCASVLRSWSRGELEPIGDAHANKWNKNITKYNEMLNSIKVNSREMFDSLVHNTTHTQEQTNWSPQESTLKHTDTREYIDIYDFKLLQLFETHRRGTRLISRAYANFSDSVGASRESNADLQCVSDSFWGRETQRRYTHTHNAIITRLTREQMQIYTNSNSFFLSACLSVRAFFPSKTFP